MNILITGGSGLVGSSMKDILKDDDKNNYIFLSSKDYDLTKFESTKLCFEKYRPNMVIHLASVVYGATSSLDAQYKSLLDKCRINLNVFENCSTYNVKKIITCLSVVLSKKDINVDTSSIIEGPELDLQYHQGYSHSKRLLHNLSISYQKANKGDVILLTPVNTYGYQDIDTSNRLIPSIIKNIKSNKQINLAPQSVRQLLYNNDLANIILKFVKMDDNSFKKSSLYPYIVGNPTLLNTKHIVKIICKELHIDIKNICFNKNNDFSRIVSISQLPFNFKYTNFEESVKKIIELYNSPVR